MSERLTQLEAGIRAAHKAGNADHVRKLGAEYRRLQSEGSAPAQAPEDNSWKGALQFGVDSAQRALYSGLQSVGELTDWEAAQTVGKHYAAEEQSQIDQRNYKRPDDAEGVWTNIKEGDIIGAGKSLGYAAAESGPSVGTGAVASLAATASAPVALGVAGGATILGGLQALGETRQEKESKGVDTQATWTDAGAAIASGLIELTPLGRGGGFTLKMTKEGIQEAGQEGLIIGNTAIQGGEYVPEEVGNRLMEAGITGGAISKGTEVAIKAPGAVLNSVGLSRTDKREFSPEEIAAAQRIKNHADGSYKVLGNVDTDDVGSAKGAANAALREARAEAESLASGLKALAKTTNNEEAKNAINSLGKIKSHQGSNTSEYALERIEKAMPGSPDVARFKSVLKEIDAIQTFTKKSDQDMGGFSRFTKKVDLTDARNNTAFGAYAMAAGGMASGSLVATMVPLTALNRAARMVDKLTNRRSRVKRFVNSAERSGQKATNIEGPSSVDLLSILKDEKTAQKAAKAQEVAAQRAQGKEAAALAKYEKQMGITMPQGPVTPRSRADLQREKELRAKIPGVSPERQAALDASNAQAQSLQDMKAETTRMNAEAANIKAKRGLEKAIGSETRQREMNKVIYADMWNGGEIPAGRTGATYEMMKHFSGADPRTALEALQGLAEQGLIDPMVVDKFQNDPDWFANNKKEAFKTQEMVRQAVNPDFKPEPYTPSKPTPETSPEEALRKLEMARLKPTSSRRKQKALEGDIRYKKALVQLEKAQPGMSNGEHRGLSLLIEEMNSPSMTRTDRYEMMGPALDIIFEGNPAMIKMWDGILTPLAAIGNDVRIERKAAEADPVQKQKEEAFEDKKRQASKRKKKPKEDPALTPEVGPDQNVPKVAVSKADKALERLNTPASEPDPETALDNPKDKSAATKQRDKKEPKVPKAPEKTKERKGLPQRVDDRIEELNYFILLSEAEGDNLDAYIQDLPKGRQGQVEGLIYQFATDDLTVNQLADAYASEYGIPPQAAAQRVNDALAEMEAEGKLQLVVPKGKGASALRHDKKIVRSEDGDVLNVVKIKFQPGPMQDRVEVAKAVRTVQKMVPQDGPDVPFTPNNLNDGAFNALKDIPADRVDGSFTPLLNFIEKMRNAKLGVSNRMLTQIEEGLSGTGAKRQGTINKVMTPLDKWGRPDDAPLKTVSQLLFQLGPKDDRPSTLIRQEWMAGANGRLYSKNSLAHSQAGDLMKGIMRTPEPHPVGGENGLKMVMHSIGNLLGYDKLAPSYRRSAIFDNDLVDTMLKFAENPFGRNTMETSRGKSTGIGEMIADGEGFFQVLNAAHEVKDMVDWARERHKDKSKLTNSQLLQDPAVTADMAENYSTDFIVQLDAKNNAYQNIGMLMGYDDVLRETGMLPMADNDPDSGEVADIYIKPAVGVAERIPELTELDLPVSKLRKLFKGPIGTYLYAAAFNSRKKSFRDTLEDMAGDAELFGIDGEPALMSIDPSLSDAMLSEDGHTFVDDHYDVNGDKKETKARRSRVVPSGQGFKVEVAEGQKGGWKAGGMTFKTPQDAIKETYATNLFARMSRELVREMNTKYPDVQKYLNFSDTVARIVKDARGGKAIEVPTRDGINLQYSFKATPEFQSAPVTLADGRVVNIGVKGPNEKMAGRGLAAFMAHQMDAYVLREVHNRMPNLKAFNPIHDSYGFHPSDATAGQDTWVKVMQELGDENYNIFQQVLEANQISLKDFVEAGGDPSIIMGRKGVETAPTSQIPTALS